MFLQQRYTVQTLLTQGWEVACRAPQQLAIRKSLLQGGCYDYAEAWPLIIMRWFGRPYDV
jgi:hypothetical protein